MSDEQRLVLVGFIFGLIVCVAILLAVTWSDTAKRVECEKNLPRNTKCVQVWVPEKQ